MIAAQQVECFDTPVVPFLDLKAQYVSIEKDIMDAVHTVCDSQQFILGRYVADLEKCIAEYSHCRFGIGVSSGTDALLAALMALDIGPGDEVITSPYTFFATAGAIARVGARPLFCDIDSQTYNIAPSKVEELLREVAKWDNGRLINRRTRGVIKAMIPVHLFGQMADMKPLMEIAKIYRLAVIEDAAQAIGAEYIGGKRAGEMGSIGCFSFFPSKNLGGFGDGGMCTTNDPQLADRLRILRAHGAKPKYHHAMIGGNFRLDELQAAVVLTKFKHLDGWTEQRQTNAHFYDEAFARAGLGANLSTPKLMPGHRHVYNQYVIRVQRRDELKQYLSSVQISTEIYYPVPLHNQQCFSYLGYQPSDCAKSTQAAHQTLALPIYPELTDVQKHQVVKAIIDFYRSSTAKG
ncbi:MAG: DegT/DnrJ/EryC1/StrS family aminotransferase [Pseudomonadota bacterium]